MATKVNYDDNLFYLISLIKTIRNGVQLELDSDYFLDKTVEDIFFVDRTLQQIHEALRLNSFLIDRKGHLKELMRAKRVFADMIDEIFTLETAFAEPLRQFEPKLRSLKEQQINDIADIQNMLETNPASEDPKDIVSQDEYRFLFQGDGAE